MKSFFRYLLRFLLFFVVLFFVFVGVDWYINRFPKLLNPKTVKYEWKYKNKEYALEETYYQSVYDYYAKKTKGIFDKSEESSIEKYLNFPEEDNVIDKLTKDLVLLANKNKLSQDETVEMIITFVQNIDYDQNRARLDKTHPLYPYEVLFNKNGICSDKSLLAVVLLRKLGYGTAFFMFPDQEHMAAGILCPKGYTNFDSKYCIVESTAIGNKIGIIPNIDNQTLQAVRPAIADFETTNKISSQQLTKVETYNQTDGFVYQGVIETADIMLQMKEIKDFLETQDKKIKEAKNQLTGLETTMTNYKSSNNLEKYNQLVPEQNSLVKIFNQLVSQYNQKVKKYNSLISE